jgi:thymidylate kinase
LPGVASYRRAGGGGPVRPVRTRSHASGRPAVTRRSAVARRFRPLVIALVGIDGSGKTTQAHRLAEALSAHGIPATYWQNAGGRRWFGRLARHLGRRDAQLLFGRGGLLLIESVLRWLAIARALLRSWLGGRVAVMDRYAVCQYASIRAHGGRPTAEWLARLAYRLFPRPDVTFLLAVDPGTAYGRIEARGTDHESLDYLAAAMSAYRELPEHAGFVVIDAGGTPEEVTRAIYAHLAADPVLPSPGLVPPVPVARPAPTVPPLAALRKPAQARP